MTGVSDAAARVLTRAVEAQGLPAELEDPQVIAAAVALLRTAPRPMSEKSSGRAAKGKREPARTTQNTDGAGAHHQGRRRPSGQAEKRTASRASTTK